MTRPVSIVPHTHWDREWHATFEQFRLRLVSLLDDLLPQLAADESFAHFLLDGQMAVVDDYLAVRPEAEGTLRDLARDGRVAMGPWYTLPDEFLVSGETLIRNLEWGRRRAADFGGAMTVGYLPDMFGHVAQMPQILAQFGFEHAVVWRGVPAAVDATGFWWSAPDGTTLRAEYLPQGYGNGARLPDDAGDFVGAVDDFVAAHGALLRGPLLWMNGTDHQLPRQHLGRVVAAANTSQDRYSFTVRSLAEHLATAVTDDLPQWRGELRSGARANLLMGVTSNRVDVRQAAARTEATLERAAEPAAALFMSNDRWPEELLATAWLEVLRNAAHDSVCACSADAVVDAVLVRYRKALDTATGLTDQALDQLAGSVATDGALIVNLSPRRRSGLIEIDLPGHGDEPGLQLLSEQPTQATLHEINAVHGATIVEREIDIRPELTGVAVQIDGPEAVVTLTAGDGLHETTPAGARAVVAALEEHAREHPDGLTAVVVEQPARRRVLAHVGDVAGYGWAPWEPATDRSIGAAGDPIDTDDRGLTNGSVAVRVEPTSGLFAINDLDGCGELVDGGDAGDTYNYSPPEHDSLVAEPDDVSITWLEQGALRSRLAVDRHYTWPAGLDGPGRGGGIGVDVRSVLELRVGEPFVRLHIEFDNPCRDHRLRLVFPLPSPTTTSTAGCAFTTVTRGLDAEGGATERPLPTYPARDHLTAGGLSFGFGGVVEYELTDLAAGAARSVALTVLRATGMLSRGPMRNRPLPAGPLDPLTGPQMIGPVTFDTVVTTAAADPWSLADAFHPLRVVQADGSGTRPPTGSALEVEGAEVSSVYRRGGRLHVRLFNPYDRPATARVGGRRGQLVDLAGTEIDSFDEVIAVGPHAIVTVALDD